MGLLRAEHKGLRSKVALLELRVENIQRDSVEVYGVAEMENKNILQTVVQLDACHRLLEADNDRDKS